MNAIVPIPRASVSVRDATLADVAFIDQLQKPHAHQVGFMRTSWIEAKIKSGQVVIAEDDSKQPVGYCMGVDRYFKRDDVGIIHQLSVTPRSQRGYVGMALLKAMFDRAAYGCRLYCCWCAQDIEANVFWEAMGFVPLAYRAGSEKKSRVHIFWQKRVREGDTETPWWFPSQTSGGALNEDRLVLPIPPGKHWSDAMPVLMPAAPAEKQLPGPRKAKAKTAPPPRRAPKINRAASLRFDIPKPAQDKKPKEKKPKRKNDPKLVGAARELRDRWLEHVNSGQAPLLPQGKYAVCRAITAEHKPIPLLAA
jgi:N-acetylglutamate synthase-like GNAT family acetyltransferase